MTIVMLRSAAAGGKVAPPGNHRHRSMLEAQRLRGKLSVGAAGPPPGRRGLSAFRIIGTLAKRANAGRRTTR
jgi:hypothetical protein